ncbi:hypothetical protein [Nonomuraea phyllanthi]|uniref:hypothetical protein n=1 Tax=Nonomuraea phyllanthi TaxID=2219224 RepID=UPI00186AFD72|nr:hypothetical protein [Nonomuraea phyllanthi]
MRSVIPAGAVNVCTDSSAYKQTSIESGTVVVTDGAVAEPAELWENTSGAVAPR